MTLQYTPMEAYGTRKTNVEIQLTIQHVSALEFDLIDLLFSFRFTIFLPVFRYHDTSSFLSIILKGELAVLAPSSSSHSHHSTSFDRVATLTASDSFGSQSLLDGLPRTTSVIALVECELAILTRRDYLEVLMHRHEEESDMENIEAEFDKSPLISLLDPEFIHQSALPPGFQLTPHLQNYIDILTRQTQISQRQQLQRQQLQYHQQADPSNHSRSHSRHLSHKSNPSIDRALAPLSSASSVTSDSTNAITNLAPIPAISDQDATFLFNLIKASKYAQMHDKRGVLLELTKSLTLHYLPPDTVLFEKGSPATYTYFILSGSCGVMSHTSYDHRSKQRAERRSRRQVVRSIVEKWEEADRKEAAELERRKNDRPHYMTHTAQYNNALRENAALIAQVQFSTEAQEKDAERKEKARLAKLERRREIEELMAEHGIDQLESSEDEEENLAKQTQHLRINSTDNSLSSSASISVPLPSSASSSSSTIPHRPPHQFPLGSCQSVLLYPENIGYADIDAHLRTLQDGALQRSVLESVDFSHKEIERANTIASSISRSHHFGVGAQAAATAVVDEMRREKEKRQIESEIHQTRHGTERNVRRTREPIVRTKKGSNHKRHASQSPSPNDKLATSNGLFESSLPFDSDTPLYLSPSFADVTYSMTCVTRESCYVARLPNSALLAALESPYHGPGVKERLNQPALRYTVLRPQDSHREEEEVDLDDPDAPLTAMKNAVSNIIPSPPSGVRLDYSHHIESLFTAMQHLKFFSIQNRELGLKLCSKMRYLSLNKGDILCKQGQLGSLFYIILSGSISIHIKPQFVVTPTPQSSAPAKQKSRKTRARQSIINSLIKESEDTVESMKSTSFKIDSPSRSSAPPSLRRAESQAGAVMIQSLMFPTTSPVEQMKQQEREQKEGEEALRNIASQSKLVVRAPHALDNWCPILSKLLDPPSRIARHILAPFSNITDLTQIDSLYGPCVKVAVSGDPIGESAIVSSNPRSATCICREPVELFCLSKEDYRSLYAVPQHLKVNTIINLLHKTVDPTLQHDDDEDGPI